MLHLFLSFFKWHEGNAILAISMAPLAIKLLSKGRAPERLVIEKSKRKTIPYKPKPKDLRKSQLGCIEMSASGETCAAHVSVNSHATPAVRYTRTILLLHSLHKKKALDPRPHYSV